MFLYMVMPKDSLIGINEGIEELTLTLLIGIKADLLQFILYPDRLLKLRLGFKR